MKKTELLYFIVALILLSIVSIDMYWWISISLNSTQSFDENLAEYYQKFPVSLRNGRLTTVINIIFLAIATFLFVKTSSVVQTKKASLVFIIISSSLMIWQIFSLM